MATLIAGRLTLLSGVSIEDYLPNEKIVVSASSSGRKFHGTRITYTDINPESNSFDSLFDIHDFSSVIFVSDFLDPLADGTNENRNLYKILENCIRCKAERIILCLPVTVDEKTDGKRALHFKELITMVHFFRDFLSLKIQCLYMPYVLNASDEKNFLYLLADSMADIKNLPWEMNSSVHFIDVFTFTEFFRSFFADDSPGEREMYLDPDFTVSFSDDILNNVNLKKYHPEETSKTIVHIRKIVDKISKHKILSRVGSAAGIFAGSFLIEILMHVLSGYAVFQTIDFRIIYIIFAALFGGFSSGTLAGLFEALMLILSYRQEHITIMMIFYSVDHMLPILFYLFLGTAVGYRQDRGQRLIDFSEHEKDASLEQYDVLSKLYVQAIEKKNEYRNDLLNSRNGFGKIFNAVNKLQSTEPDRIMADAIPVMEDLLSNKSISIYSIFASDPDYARLQVASKDIYGEVPRSIKLSDKPLISESMQKGEVWFNRDMAGGYPMYVAPIVQDGSLIALIEIMKADFSETSLYYQNLLSIISKLIGNFIATAITYQRAIADKNYVQGTKIYSREALERRLSLIYGMQQEQISTYRIFEIFTEGRRLSDMDAFLRPLVRPLDFLGLIDDEHIMLIAANTDDYGATIILRRLSQAGLSCKSLEMPEKDIDLDEIVSGKRNEEGGS